MPKKTNSTSKTTGKQGGKAASINNKLWVLNLRHPRLSRRLTVPQTIFVFLFFLNSFKLTFNIPFLTLFLHSPKTNAAQTSSKRGGRTSKKKQSSSDEDGDSSDESESEFEQSDQDISDNEEDEVPIAASSKRNRPGPNSTASKNAPSPSSSSFTSSSSNSSVIGDDDDRSSSSSKGSKGKKKTTKKKKTSSSKSKSKSSKGSKKTKKGGKKQQDLFLALSGNASAKSLTGDLLDTYNKGKKNNDSTVIVKLLNLIFRCSGMSSGVTFDSNNLTIHNNAEEEDGK